jgi:outer membrane protein TolC
MPRGRTLALTLVAATLVIVTDAGAQSISLEECIARSDRAAFAIRSARGEAEVAAAASTAALRGILPSMRFEGGYARTTDPIGAFGTTMRQRRLDAADFDPARLNHPAPVTNYTGAMVVEQPLVNADAWLGRAAAAAGGKAAASSVTWTTLTAHGDVVLGYYGAVLSGERVRALEDAARTADAHVREAESMVAAGMATRSDALLASVRAGDVHAQLSSARADAATAVRQLALLLGDVTASDVAVPGALPSSDDIRRVVARDTAYDEGATRADVEAASFGVAAAEADVRRASALYLPRLNAVARYDWNSALRPYAGGASWSVGVVATWTPFSGAGELAERQAARGRETTARALAEAARQQELLERERTRSTLRSALEQLTIADHAVAQSSEAHRIVSRKYAGGLATVVELLDAASAETRASLGAAGARYAVITAAVERRKALGADPAALASLERTSGIATGTP